MRWMLEMLMSAEPSHVQCMELLANPSTQRILEAMGYEYSERGLADYRRSRPNIVPALVRAIVAELERHPVFPSRYTDQTPEVGVYIRKLGNDFVFKEIDKPSVWQEHAFSNPEGAARAYIQRVIDAYWLKPDKDIYAPTKSVRSSWLKG
ncbi:MAG: hypothetical protein ABSH22_05640 [Tepidisphaeraceae bacterium]|jgi:hypothetical protein